MIGIVLWRDVEDDKAVIWCEDQGDLAFMNSVTDENDRNVELDVGDIVRFDIECVRELRIAKKVTLLLDNWGSVLKDALLNLPEEPTQTGQSGGAEVVAINTWHGRVRKPDFAPERRRMG